MDLSPVLVTGLKKKVIISFVAMNKGDKEVIKALVSTIKKSSQPANRKAVWVLRQWGQMHPKDLSEQLNPLIEQLGIERDSSVIRDLMSIFLSVELNDEQQGRILDKAFAFLNSGTYDLGVMFNSMKFLEKSCRQWPDLIPEFVEVLKRQRDLHTSTFCKQATKLIFKFEKLR